MKKRVIALALSLALLLALTPAITLPAAAAAPTDALAGVAYYGDPSQCVMPADMALAYAKVLGELPQSASVTDEYSHISRTGYLEATLLDPSGDGMPILMVAYVLPDGPLQLRDYQTDPEEFRDAMDKKFLCGGYEFWEYRDGAATKANFRRSAFNSIGLLDGKGAMRTANMTIVAGDCEHANYYVVENGKMDLAHTTVIYTTDNYAGSADQAWCAGAKDFSYGTEEGYLPINALAADGWATEREGGCWERYVLDGENVTQRAMDRARQGIYFPKGFFSYERVADIEDDVYWNDYICLDLTPAADLAAALETYAAALTPAACAATQAVEVDGKKTLFQMYALKDENGYATNYVKLRDVAYVLNGTPAQFNVTWSAEAGIGVTTGRAYTPDGSEMATPFSGDRAYTDLTETTNVNGTPTAIQAIRLTDDNGGAYTYYKLRDLGQYLGFHVDWSAQRGVFLETDKLYGGASRSVSGGGKTSSGGSIPVQSQPVEQAEPEWAKPYLRVLEKLELPEHWEAGYDTRAVIFGDFDLDGGAEMFYGYTIGGLQGRESNYGGSFYDVDLTGQTVEIGHEELSWGGICPAEDGGFPFELYYDTQSGCTFVAVSTHSAWHGATLLVGQDQKGVMELRAGKKTWYVGDDAPTPEEEAFVQRYQRLEGKETFRTASAIESADQPWGYDLWLQTARAYSK